MLLAPGLCAALLCSTACAQRMAFTIQDAQTAMRLKTTILNDDVVGTEDVRVDVVDGVAYLSGHISSDAHRARLVELARATTGVRDVRVDLAVRPEIAVLRQQLSVAPGDPDRGQRHVLALGLSARMMRSEGAGLEDTVDLTPIFRIRSRGLAPALGFGWSTRDLAAAPDDRRALAELRIRPVMGGLAYTHPLGRTALIGSLVAGYAFNSVQPDAAAAGPLRAIRSTNALAVRPGAALWVDLTDRAAMQFSLSYTRCRPRVTYASDDRLLSSVVNADALTFSIGAAYWVF